jgi:hypothetical protein
MIHCAPLVSREHLGIAKAMHTGCLHGREPLS